MKQENPIVFLSLGAGVQSSTMALMASEGLIQPKPEVAIFADTQAEPNSVYRWLDWLEPRLSFKVVRVSAGNLELETLKIRQKKDEKGSYVHSGIPHYSINGDGSLGHGQRQCTADFKLDPIRKALRRMMREQNRKGAISLIGISLDESDRVKDSPVQYITNRYPLIDANMTRNDCLAWMQSRGFPTPPRSSCVFCPYHSDAEWIRLKTEEPDCFQKAIRFEKAYQAAKAVTVSAKGFLPFLHPSRKPLETVEFKATNPRRDFQLNLFRNDCSGMCGT